MRLPLPRSTAAVLAALVGAAVAPCYVAEVSSATPSTPSSRAQRVEARQIDYRQWDTGAELGTGTLHGLKVVRGTLRIDQPAAERKVQDKSYEQGSWDSPWVEPGFAFTELIGSWSALTPGNSFVEIRVRGRSAAGKSASYDLLARWTSGDKYLARATTSGQTDDLASVNVDTWVAPAGLTSYQVRVTIARKAGSTLDPSVDVVGAVTSRLPAEAGATSKPGVASGIVLDVPRYSQMIHEGDYPEWNGGGEAWCSPTSTSMVLGYYKALPPRSAYSWVPQGHPDPWVDHAARMTYDYDYGGTGNWPFNTAYAAPLAGKAFVTRMRSLRQAEALVKAGIPVVASISFRSGELSGAPISSTSGHLLVIVGFTDDGDVVVNDPASSTKSGVRRTYDRGQLERAWLNGSGGTAYVIHDAAHPLPKGNSTSW